MRVFFMFFFGLCTTVCFAQNSKIANDEQSSFGIFTSYRTFVGDNFLAKSYNNYPTFGMQFSLNVYKKFNVGAFYRYNQAKIISTQYVGNTQNSSVSDFGVFLSYSKKLSNKWLFIPKIGIGGFNLKNQIIDNRSYERFRYYTFGSVFFIAPEINYFINKDLIAFTVVDYGFVDFTGITASKAAGTNYNAANQLNFALGIKVGF
ncbi:MAG: hypothetical protein EAZ15_01625 [Sphingobacteriales bacterium]|nr:MAG: hypothetical protein EAZ15_01625 [Sphingobacteriales bacterium]